jgi:hypothetical protein
LTPKIKRHHSIKSAKEHRLRLLVGFLQNGFFFFLATVLDDLVGKFLDPISQIPFFFRH